MRTAEFEVLPQQGDFIQYDGLFSAAYGGVGSGKTFAAQWKMWQRLRKYPKARHYVCGADFEQLREGYFADFRNLLEDTLQWQEGKDYRYRDSPRPSIILLDTGARIRAISSELAERMRSLQIQSLHGEEPQTWHNGEKVWRTLVTRMRHAIRTAKAYPTMPIQAWLTFNPGGDPGVPIGSWLHQLLEVTWKKRDYHSWRFSLIDNYLLENHAQYIQNIRDHFPFEQHEVEIEGKYPTFGGGVYRNYSRKLHSVDEEAFQTGLGQGLPPFVFDTSKPLRWTWDFNVEYQSSLLAQKHTQNFKEIGEKPLKAHLLNQKVEKIQAPLVDDYQRILWYFFAEFRLNGRGVDDVVDAFAASPWYQLALQCPGIVIYGDPSGGSRAQTDNWTCYETIWDKLNKVGFRGKVKFKVQSSHPGVKSRVEIFNRHLRYNEKVGIVIDHPQCEFFVKDLQETQWKANGDIDKLTNKELTHMGDASSYMVYLEDLLDSGQQAKYLEVYER